jgi:hypothetical protein
MHMQDAKGRPQAATHPMVSGSAAQPPVAATVCAQLSAIQDILVFPSLHLQPAAWGTGQQSVAHVNPTVRTLFVLLGTSVFMHPFFAGVMKLSDISLLILANSSSCCCVCQDLLECVLVSVA